MVCPDFFKTDVKNVEELEKGAKHFMKLYLNCRDYDFFQKISLYFKKLFKTIDVCIRIKIKSNFVKLLLHRSLVYIVKKLLLLLERQ